jgi:hypothetical protein
MGDKAGSDEKARDNQLRASLNQKLLETGEKDKLKEFIRNRLAESGWHDEGEVDSISTFPLFSMNARSIV